jgi:PTS system galactitol-specific IIA component
MLEFNEAQVAFNLDVADSQNVIDVLAGKLCNRGLVTEDYGRLTYERELEHPTGLPTKPFCIAFPHADAFGVIQSALGVAILKKPVLFKNMADPDENLEVHIVLMLANKNPEEQIQTLRNLAILFGEPDKLSELRNQSSPQDVTAWLTRELRLS